LKAYQVIRKYLSFFVFTLLVWSCSGDEEVIVKKDSDFFPIQVGAFFVYNVEETQYSVLEGQKDYVYQLKFSVTDSFPNNAGGITYVIQRSKKNSNDAGFSYLDTWSVRKEASEVIVNEGNIAFVRLAFPLDVGKEWNGNALNALGGEQNCGQGPTFPCDLYKVTGKGTPFEFNGETLTETIEVTLNNNTDLIVKQDVRTELYARNVGLVLKSSTVLEYCTVGACIGKQQIEKGYILKQTLTSYGKE